MSSLREHIERVMRRGIEPENYMPAPEPPAPVENSGIGRSYVGPYSIYFDRTHQCSECGSLVHDIPVHERWHGGAVA